MITFTHLYVQNKGLCSARGHGIRGLGTELVKRADSLALQLGCSHRYVICSGQMQRYIFIFSLIFSFRSLLSESIQESELDKY